MLFNSFEFIFLFLPAVFAGFFLIAKTSHRLAALWLAAASLFFYGWWNPKYVLLLLASITLNYSFGYVIGHARAIGKSNTSLRLLTAAVSMNLMLLAYFKYANFFISSSNQVVGTHWGALDVILPLGISFFSFTQIAFLVDVHRGIAREYNFVHYVLFVTYFPHLIAGPVLHHRQMMPQFAPAATYRIDSGNILSGLCLFAIGLAKKVLLADQFGIYANGVFDAPLDGGVPSLTEGWIGVLAYSMQLYFDFSGYSDMAMGLSLLFNITLPQNFNSPYKAANIIEFWRRWHITLSDFLREYLYISLGGNRSGQMRRWMNLIVTMLLGGLWHGANWTFVIWGGLHGLFLVINHAWRRVLPIFGVRFIAGGIVISRIVTLIAVVVAWIPFRSSNIDVSVEMFKAITGTNGVAFGSMSLTGFQLAELFVWFPMGLSICLFAPNAIELMNAAKTSRERGIGVGVLSGTLLGLSLLSFGRKSDFLYFQF